MFITIDAQKLGTSALTCQMMDTATRSIHRDSLRRPGGLLPGESPPFIAQRSHANTRRIVRPETAAAPGIQRRLYPQGGMSQLVAHTMMLSCPPAPDHESRPAAVVPGCPGNWPFPQPGLRPAADRRPLIMERGAGPAARTRTSAGQPRGHAPGISSA